MKVLLVPNYSRSVAIEAAQEISEWLEGQDIEVAWAHDKKRDPKGTTSVNGAELVVSLGGDGTLLRAAKIVGYSEVPLLGLSFGHLGFLTGAGSDHVIESVAQALAGEMHVSRRATLSVRLDMLDASGQECHTDCFALNELSLTRGAAGDMIEMDVSVSGTHIDRIRGDGFVVATATGSTGYSLAAGGPFVHPDYAGMVCVPIAPHTIQARAFLTGPSDVVELTMSPERPAERSAFLDGQLEGGDAFITHASISRGPGDIILLDGGPSAFYNSVSRVFYGRVKR